MAWNSENRISDDSNLIIVGQCNGTYENDKVRKEFQAKVLVSARPDGTIIVHNLSDGVRPLVYLDGGAQVSVRRNDPSIDGVGLEFYAATENGQKLTIKFTEVTALQGLENGYEGCSMALNVLQCVLDMGGKYGRTTIARVLTGSVSKKILTIDINKLKTYGVARHTSMKEVLALMDWLIDENYLAYVEDTEFPVLVVTAKGLGIIAGSEMLKKAA